MFYVILVLLCFALLAVALFYFLRSNELNSQLRQASEAWSQKEEDYTSELGKLEKLRHIPDVIEKARKTKEHAEAKLADARNRADEILHHRLRGVTGFAGSGFAGSSLLFS
jgi:C4-dicarboxylate-specific signal transduction histidine kinase